MIELFDLAGRDTALRFSPYCWRIRLALAHKGLPVKLMPWRFHEKARLPGAPGNNKVPVLVDGDTVLAGSSRIAAYLEEYYGNGPSLFGGAAGEAHAHFIVAWTDSALIPALAPAVAPYVLPVLHKADRDYFRETRERRLGASLDSLQETVPDRIEQARRLLTPLRVCLADQSFIGGDEPSYADYAVFSALQWARCVAAPPVLLPDDPLQRWQDDMLDLFDGLARTAKIAA